MILEPSRFFQRVLENILRDAGFQVSSFSDSESLLSEIKRSNEPLGLVCLSLKLGKDTGTRIARELRELPATRMTPLILITSSDSEQEIQEALSAGITEVFYKSDLPAFQDYTHNTFHQSQGGSLKASKILYLEDSPSTAKLIISWLDKLKGEVLHFTRAEEALEAFKKNPSSFDLVLSDFLLAGKMSGLGLIREIRSTGNQHLPILMISGLEDSARKLEILRSGANDYVAKPVLEEELLARVSLLLEHRHLYREVEIQRKKISELRQQDPLTGLFNRHYLMERLPGILEQQKNEAKDLSLCMIHLDNLAHINESQGFQKGDDLLVIVADLIKQCSPEQGICGRFGGLTFLLALPAYTSGKAFNTCEDLRASIYNHEQNSEKISVSIGLSSLDDLKENSFDSLFAQAKKALDQAISKGMNRVERL